MNPTELLDELRSHGATLTVAEGRLRITAPKGVVSPSLLRALRQRKAELIALHNQRAREELDRFFTQVILPRLSALHQAGMLPNLALCPLWARVKAEWDTAAADSALPCDIERVRLLMSQTIQRYLRQPIEEN